MGLHQPPQLPIQGYVGHIIRGEHQQVRRLLTPANLLLGESKPSETQPLPSPLPCTWSQPRARPAAHSLALIRRVPCSCPPIPGTKTKCQEHIQHFLASPSNTLHFKGMRRYADCPPDLPYPDPRVRIAAAFTAKGDLPTSSTHI